MIKSSQIRLLLFSLLCTILLCGCLSTGHVQTTSADPSCQPPVVVLDRNPWMTDDLLLPAEDPMEGFNRSMHSLNIGLNKYLLSPIAKCWRAVVPGYIRDRISCFNDNIQYPGLLLSHALQAQWRECGIDSQRFFINTTVGLLGLWDPAQSRWNIAPAPGGFDNTLANWDIDNGVEVTLPIASNGTVRSQIGAVLDHLADWTPWVLGTSGVTLIYTGVSAVNGYAEKEPEVTRMSQVYPYSYLLANLMSWYSREVTNTRYQYDRENPEWDADPSFGIVALRPQDSQEISNATRERTITVCDGKITYSCWPSKEASRLVILLPGIGTHRKDQSVEALAELFRNQGCAVMALSSQFVPDFFEDLPDDTQPAGYLPEDAKMLATVLEAAVEDFKKTFRGKDIPSCSLVGFSLGGLDTLFLAAMEDQDGRIAGKLSVDKYVALNPPYDGMNAVFKVDDFFNLPSTWHSDSTEATQHVQDILKRLICWVQPSIYNPPSAKVPLTREESRFAIGMVMRLHLADCLQKQQEKNPTGLFQGSPKTFAKRNAIHIQALSCTYKNYLDHVVLPWYHAHGHTEMNRQTIEQDCRLASIGSVLAANGKVHVFQNRDDLLIEPGDINWYTTTLGNRATIFDIGGHLGNMASPQFKDLLIKTVME